MDADDGLQQTWNGRSRVWVAYACTTEEVQQHFESCRTVNRATMLTEKFGQPNGFAYVEFPEAEAVQEALALNESELHGRPLKVLPKRTNVPGYKQFHPGLTICIWVTASGGLMYPVTSIRAMDMGTFQGSECQQGTCPTVRRLFIMPY